MTDIPAGLFQRWGHSFEEDKADVQVYRPAGYNFPRTRGRDGIEFRSDGGFIEWIVGRGDANEPVAGRWSQQTTRVLRIEYTGNTGPIRLFEIVELTPEILTIR